MLDEHTTKCKLMLLRIFDYIYFRGEVRFQKMKWKILHLLSLMLICLIHCRCTSSDAVEVQSDGSVEDTYPCNIDRILLDLSSEITVLPEKPVIYVEGRDRNHKLASLASKKSLEEKYGSTIVKLTSSNTYSHGLETMSLAEYFSLEIDRSEVRKFANESLYLFGNNYNGVFKEMSNLYQLPRCRYCKKAGAVTLGIGGADSGVAFHYHGPGFSESIIGRKRWFLFPGSSQPPGFHPNVTVQEWALHSYPVLLPEHGLHECVIQPGEYLYFPSMWMHATLNIDPYNVFVSLFLDTQLMH